MSKKKLFLALIILSVLGSIVSFYATNLILSDVANMFYMSLTKDVISSIPIFLIAAEFVIASIGAMYFGLYPSEQKRLMRMNAGAVAVLSSVGAVCSVLSGTIIYGSFIAPYPFPSATILTLVFHTALIALSVLTIRKCRDAETAPKSIGRRLGRGVQWVLMAVFVYYAFDRLGAVLWLPTYVQISAFNKTILFYLSLLLPSFLLLHHCRYRLDLYWDKEIAGIVYPLIYLAADLLLCAAVITGGMNDTQVVSAISLALGIERLLGKPVVTIAHFSLMTLPILGSLAAALFKLLRKRQSKAHS